MIIKSEIRRKSSSKLAKPAVDYVLSDKDHKGELRPVAPEILKGDPGLTRDLDNAFKNSVKEKARSGIIGFKNNEEWNKIEDKQEFINRWEELTLGSLKDRLNALYVAHGEEGEGEGTHIHFIINTVDLDTKHLLNPFAPRPQENGRPMWITAMEATERVLAYEFGLDQVERKKTATNDNEIKLAKGYVSENSKDIKTLKANISSKADMSKLAGHLINHNEISNFDEFKAKLLEQPNIHSVEFQKNTTNQVWIKYTSTAGEQKSMKMTGKMWKKDAPESMYRSIYKPKLAPKNHGYTKDDYLKDISTINRFQSKRAELLNEKKFKNNVFTQAEIKPFQSQRMMNIQNDFLNSVLRKTNIIQNKAMSANFRKQRALDNINGIRKKTYKEFEKDYKNKEGKRQGFSIGSGATDKQGLIQQIADLKGALLDHSLPEEIRDKIGKQLIELELQLEKMMIEETMNGPSIFSDNNNAKSISNNNQTVKIFTKKTNNKSLLTDEQKKHIEDIKELENEKLKNIDIKSVKNLKEKIEEVKEVKEKSIETKKDEMLLKNSLNDMNSKLKILTEEERLRRGRRGSVAPKV